ncbi:ankyrin repeat and LEM domain-containing protein 2 homolog isoform X2 [Diprion similis]|uniref:ankyrin repeat and LEM domain-containing protein 2 homolog isoform X2 n=1 Tax=Diprion similis TaxID=362088 RepID=UPI001EF8B18C|nr:ankyrin repeat and LEM domain-containing protein 2 homolog isoform X2 [Diprion similis]
MNMDTDHVNLNPSGLDTVYYGVYVPQEDSNWFESKDQLYVYTDKNEALNVIKKYKKGRFKSFKTYDEAKNFAEHGNEQLFSLTTGNQSISNKRTGQGEEKSSNFKAPKHQENVQFRKFIENGDLARVKQIVWENPRYLISSGDTPAILREGPRYNALHVAVRVGCRADMCELILNTVGNPDFIKLLDGEDDYSNYLNRAQILVDLYLNTPTKGLNETPLHFAVKFGLKEVVQILVSYPQCLKTTRNKYEQIPADIICSRKCQEDEILKREILSLLDELYYVPVIRSEDNTTQPLIGELFSPTSPLKLNTDPISPRVEVSAFAGPMSKNKAVEFRRKWKTPPRIRNTPTKRLNLSFDDSYTQNSPASNTIYRLQDTEKGLERVGRDLAKEYHVAWKEYWPFLNGFADLTSKEGLAKLEEFFQQKFNNPSEQSTEKMDNEAYPINGNDQEKDYEMNVLCTQLSFSTLNILDHQGSNKLDSIQNRLSCDLTGSDEEYEFFTPPSSPRSVSSDSDDDMYTAEQGDMIFIQGNTASKLDYAVYHAISDMDLSPHLYPNIYRWRHQLRLITENESSRS